MKIIIPSHKRHDRVMATQVVEDPIVCVPKAQGSLYRQYNQNVEILEHPDSIIGLAAKRQWIYEKFGDVWMMDDDVDGIKRSYVDEDYLMSPHEVREMLYNVYQMAVELGVYLFGLSKNPRPIHYYPHHPILITGFISGGVHGVRDPKHSKIYYNPELINNDFWISLLNAFHNRTTLIDTRFAFSLNHAMPFL